MTDEEAKVLADQRTMDVLGGACGCVVPDRTPPEVREIRARAARFQCCGRWIDVGHVCSCGGGGLLWPRAVKS